jgi:lysophospholipase L1-like esterase
MLMLLRFSFCLLLVPSFQDAESNRVEKYEKDIVAIEKRLKTKPPSEDTIFFTGSSTIRRWNLPENFPGLPYENCGFGGSQTRDVVHFAPRILLPYKPKTIVFYSGDNDINAKRTPEQVAEDFQAFVKFMHKDNPKTKIILLGIKHSASRDKQKADQIKANKILEAFCKTNPQLLFVDIAPLFLDSSGEYKSDHFADDKLHLSPKGYEVLAEKIKPLLK